MGKKALTKAQLEEKGNELAVLVKQLESLQTKHKDKKQKMKAAEVDLEVQISALATEVESGQMEVDDQADAFEDQVPKGKKKLAAVVEDDEEAIEDEH